LKEPAVLQGFYKILWWKHPVELTGKDLHYIFLKMKRYGGRYRKPLAM